MGPEIFNAKNTHSKRQFLTTKTSEAVQPLMYLHNYQQMETYALSFAITLIVSIGKILDFTKSKLTKSEETLRYRRSYDIVQCTINVYH